MAVKDPSKPFVVLIGQENQDERRRNREGERVIHMALIKIGKRKDGSFKFSQVDGFEINHENFGTNQKFPTPSFPTSAPLFHHPTPP